MSAPSFVPEFRHRVQESVCALNGNPVKGTRPPGMEEEADLEISRDQRGRGRRRRDLEVAVN